MQLQLGFLTSVSVGFELKDSDDYMKEHTQILDDREGISSDIQQTDWTGST